MAGLSGVARDVIVADLAGARKIYVVSPSGEPADWRRSFEVRDRPLPDVVFVSDMAEVAAADGERLVMLPADRVPTVEGLRQLVLSPDGARPGKAGLWFGPGDPGAVTWEILQASMKPSEGWFGRHLNRPISFRISALLMRTDISPNAVTWLTFFIAVAMMCMLGEGGLLWLALGGLLYQVVSVVDCVDGDIARVTYQTSRAGAALDTTFDMLANLGFVATLTIGLLKTYGPGQLQLALVMLAVAALCILLMTLLIRLGPRQGSFDVLRAALTVRLAGWPRLGALVLTAEKLFKRDFYALFAALMCVTGLAWMLPQFALGGVCIWLMAILWCAPVIVADKRGDLLPAHLKA